MNAKYQIVSKVTYNYVSIINDGNRQCESKNVLMFVKNK